MAQAQYQKPLPAISSLNKPYWEGLCNAVNYGSRNATHARKYGIRRRRYVPRCWSRKFTWTRLSGRGRVNSWVVFHQSYFRGL